MIDNNDSYTPQYTINDDKLKELTELANNHWAKVDLKTNGNNYNIVGLKDIKIHNLVLDLTPPMDDAEFEALLNDIALNGQIEPIKIWRKRGSMFVVDGRNRINALTLLGIEYVKYIEVKILSLDDLKVNILAWDKRRKTSMSQKAVRAFKDYLANNIDSHTGKPKSMDNIAAKWMINKSYLSHCKYIYEARGGGIALLNELFDKRVVDINGQKYRSLYAIKTALAKTNKVEVVSRDNNDPLEYGQVKSMLHSLKNNGDLVSLSCAVRDAKRLINELNNED
jgi:hypothetical protein